jgi:NAD(P)-dependent dehydrogenase (short-subunit alcohol dehydrogenase family)
MKDVRDRVGVITGAGSGIGLALAERFVAAGMKVVLSDVEPGPLEQVTATLRERGAAVHAVPADVSSPEQVRALAQETLRAFGAVHVVCNNAGIFEPGAVPSWDTSADDWAWILGVNLMGVVHGIQAFMPILQEQGEEAHIVNTASIGGWISGNPLYSVSKFGVVALSEALYAELRRSESKVGVSLLCPGYVKTRLAASERNRPLQLSHASPHSRAREALMQRFGQAIDAGIEPEEVAEHTLAAILNDRFYVFTHDDSVGSIEQKIARLRAGENPRF